MKQKLKKKDILPRLKLWLLSGKEITHIQALRKFGTNRLSEYVRRLRRNENMNIVTITRIENGSMFGVYKYVPKEKVSRIVTQEYR